MKHPSPRLAGTLLGLTLAFSIQAWAFFPGTSSGLSLGRLGAFINTVMASNMAEARKNEKPTVGVLA